MNQEHENILYDKTGNIAKITLNRPEDRLEGMKTFAEKRAPEWKGK